jgi:hypothetical protein
MLKHNPFLGMAAADLAAHAAKLNHREWDAVRAAYVGQPVNDEVALVSRPDPFGVTTDADGRIVVDDFTNPISNIPALIREMTRDNQGYWIEDVFNSPGWTLQGGAVAYQVSGPGDHFLPDGSRPAPRAPGSEAPRISGTRRRPIVAYAQNLSASLEVSDEARQDNDVIQVQTTFRQAANTFADIMQGIGEASLAQLVSASSRNVNSGSGTFADWAAADPIYNTNSTDPRPAEEFARVKRLFVEDKGGVQPDTLIWDPVDAEHFDRVYQGMGDDVLRRYGITRVFTTVRATAGVRTYLKSGQVGTLAWAKPFGDPEYTREGTRFTDVYTMDGRFVFVANGADAILQVTKT